MNAGCPPEGYYGLMLYAAWSGADDMAGEGDDEISKHCAALMSTPGIDWIVFNIPESNRFAFTERISGGGVVSWLGDRGTVRGSPDDAWQAALGAGMGERFPIAVRWLKLEDAKKNGRVH